MTEMMTLNGVDLHGLSDAMEYGCEWYRDVNMGFGRCLAVWPMRDHMWGLQSDIKWEWIREEREKKSLEGNSWSIWNRIDNYFNSLSSKQIDALHLKQYWHHQRRHRPTNQLHTQHHLEQITTNTRSHQSYISANGVRMCSPSWIW
jgi:hypothetical protein